MYTWFFVRKLKAIRLRARQRERERLYICVKWRASGGKRVFIYMPRIWIYLFCKILRGYILIRNHENIIRATNVVLAWLVIFAFIALDLLIYARLMLCTIAS